MGEIYARAAGEPEAVARAVGEQYLPLSATAPVPATLAGGLLAVAEKADNIAGAWVAGEKPSGSRDPYGLRRAAMGIVRIALAYELARPGARAARERARPVRGAGRRRARPPTTARRSLDETHGLRPGAPPGAPARRRPARSPSSRRRSARPPATARARRPRPRLRRARRARDPRGRRRRLRPLRLAGRQGRAAPAGRRRRPTRRSSATKPSASSRRRSPTPRPPSSTRSATSRSRARSPPRRPCAPAVDRYFDDVLVMDPDETIRDNRLAQLAAVTGLLGRIGALDRLPTQEEGR